MSDQSKEIAVSVVLALGPCIAASADQPSARSDCDEADVQHYLSVAKVVHGAVSGAFRESFGEPDTKFASEVLGTIRGVKKFCFTYEWATEIGDLVEFEQEWRSLAAVIALMVGAKDYWVNVSQFVTEGSRLYEEAVAMLPGGTEPVDVNKAIALLQRAIERGHLQARVGLAEVLRKGWHGVRDIDGASNVAKPAADAGYLPAMYMLGSISAEAQKHEVAAYWFERASKHRNPAAVFWWGVALQRMAGSSMNASAEQRDLEKEAGLYRKSFELIQEAAIQKHPLGAASVAVSCLFGVGTRKDNPRAYAWATIAIREMPEEHSQQSRHTADQARSLMTSAEFAAARQMLLDVESNGLVVLAESEEARRQFDTSGEETV